MRLKKAILEKIKSAIYNSFGNVDIYLFGSRLDDSKNGGDIDIAIDVDLPRLEFRKKKAQSLSNLIRGGFELKIDIVNYNTKDALLSKEIKQNGLLI